MAAGLMTLIWQLKPTGRGYATQAWLGSDDASVRRNVHLDYMLDPCFLFDNSAGTEIGGIGHLI
jgi:hypothetical protein